MILPLNERRKLRVEREFFQSRGEEECEFILDVFTQRCLQDIQVATSGQQLEMPRQAAKPGTVSFLLSRQGK